jgi:hypothetical protein
MGLRELMKIDTDPKVEPEKGNSLEYLQRIYRDPTQPIAVRMRAAIEAMPFETPRVSAVTVGYIQGNDFASRLERAIEAAEKAKLIEGRVLPESE